jgi:IS5 family transposase
LKQVSFASLAYEGKKKQTRKEKFLSEMDQIIPWKKLTRLIKPHYPKGGNGRPPMGVEKMLRIYFMQQWFKLSDPAMEDALYDVQSMARFAGVDLNPDPVPDESTILKFRHLLEKHNLTAKLFEATCGYLEDRGLMLREGTIVDATLIAAPSSTKNQDKKRDPEMTQTRKGNRWYFGMKAHTGTDPENRVVHTIVATTASVHDSQVMVDLLNGEEEAVWGDKAYADEAKKAYFEERGVKWCVSKKAFRGTTLSRKDKEYNRWMSKTRARGEHPFHVVKCLWGYRKVRYRGIAKNAAQLFTLFSLANLYLVRKKLLYPQHSCA